VLDAIDGRGDDLVADAPVLNEPLSTLVERVRQLGFRVVALADLSGQQSEDDALQAIGRLKDLEAPLQRHRGFDSEILFMTPTTFELSSYVWHRASEVLRFAPYSPEEIMGILWVHHRRLGLADPSINALTDIFPVSIVRLAWREHLSITDVVLGVHRKLLRLLDGNWREVYTKLALGEGGNVD
jgi:hypothetical protein